MRGKPKRTTGSANVFADLGFAPDEADNLLLRAKLMSHIRGAARGMTQQDAAALFGVSQPRISDLKRDKIGRFTIDTLVNMLAHAGIKVGLQIGRTAATARVGRQCSTRREPSSSRKGAISVSKRSPSSATQK